jgi:hypothetical protein
VDIKEPGLNKKKIEKKKHIRGASLQTNVFSCPLSPFSIYGVLDTPTIGFFLFMVILELLESEENHIHH